MVLVTEKEPHKGTRLNPLVIGQNAQKESGTGQVKTVVKVQNFIDIVDAGRGMIPADKIRTVELEGIVDTGASYLCLPPSAIEQLGLIYSHTRQVQTAKGEVERRFFKGADVTIQGRNEHMTVMENDMTTPNLVGYLVLEALDFLVDPKKQQVIANPEHGGNWVADLY